VFVVLNNAVKSPKVGGVFAAGFGATSVFVIDGAVVRVSAALVETADLPVAQREFFLAADRLVPCNELGGQLLVFTFVSETRAIV
jgi:hypothetical protein